MSKDIEYNKVQLVFAKNVSEKQGAGVISTNCLAVLC